MVVPLKKSWGRRVADLAQLSILLVILPLLFAAGRSDELPSQRLDGPTRAKMLTVLVAIIILGVVLVAMASWALRTARHRIKSGLPSSESSPYAEFGVDDWARKPLVPTDPLNDEERSP